MWSELPRDLLERILARLEPLDLRDHLRFRAVCASWRSIAAEDRAAINKPLALVYSSDPIDLVRRFYRFHGFSWPHTTAHGSFEGWLVIRDGRESACLLHAALGSRIPLPPIRYLGKTVLSSIPSSGNCTVVTIDRRCRCLKFCRPGDEAWAFFAVVRCYWYMDIMFHKGQLYAVDQDGNLEVFESEHKSKQISLWPAWTKCWWPLYLLDLCGELVLIRSSSSLKRFDFLRIRGSSCAEVESLGDNAVFLDRRCCMALSTEDHPWLQRNCIYLSRSVRELCGLEQCLYWHDLYTSLDRKMQTKPAFFRLFSG